MSYLFLFREKDSDDRDCCAYIDSKNPRFECNHYFGSVNLNGACYTGHEFPAYEDIETVLTKAEYNELVQFNKAINDLGYADEIMSINAVYSNFENAAEETARSLGFVNDMNEAYFDFELFENSLRDNENYIELPSGVVVHITR